MTEREIATSITLKALETGWIATPEPSLSPEKDTTRNAQLIGEFFRIIYKTVMTHC